MGADWTAEDVKAEVNDGGSSLWDILEPALADSKEWVAYEGERGGEGWRNTETGEIVYQDEKPSGGAENESDSTDDTSPGDDVDDVEFMEGKFEEFGTESQREVVSDATRSWVGWPTDKKTAPMWHAAEEQTFNDNDPSTISNMSMLRVEADPSAVDAMTEYQEYVSDTLESEIEGDTITAHRFIHGEAAEKLRSGESLPPRTLASWTTDEEKIAKVADDVGFDEEGDPIQLNDSVVVTKEIPIENAIDHHAVNPQLNDGGQKEMVAGLSKSDDLSEGEVQEATEMVRGEEAATATAKSRRESRSKADIPNILLGYDFEPPEGMAEESDQ